METGGLCCVGRQRQRWAVGAGEARARLLRSLMRSVRGAASEGGGELSTLRMEQLSWGSGAWLSHLDLRIGETLGGGRDDSD